MTPQEAALVAQVHREDRDAWEREVEREHDPCARGKRVVVVGGRKYVKGTTGTTFWWGMDRFSPGRFKVGVHPDDDPEGKMWIDARWLRVIDTCEPSLAEYTSTDDEALAIVHETCPEVGPCEVLNDDDPIIHPPEWYGRGSDANGELNAPPPHRVGGKTIGPEGVPYGTTHDGNCPACIASGASFTSSPRSETYWSS
jgi:hypothetical protein